MNIKKLRGVGIILELIVVALAGMLPRSASATPAGYTFTKIAALGGPTPGQECGNFTFDFEPWSMNNRSEVAFAVDLTTGGEGVFLLTREDQELQTILCAGQPAPGGGTFGGFGVFGHTALNDRGDMAFAFGLEPFTPLLGANAGVYRFSRHRNELSAVVVPDVTPAPGGGVFKGAPKHASLNNRGDIAFAGMVSGADIDPSTPPGIDGLGTGIFRADKHNQIFSVMRPGDPAPGSGTFDFGEDTWINDRSDIAFGAHVAGEECIDFGVPQSSRLFCATSIYIKKASTGEIQSIAHQGDPAPGGGTYRLAFGPVLNNLGQIAFIGDLTPAPDFGQDLGVFLHVPRVGTMPVARPGDPMPGGGHLRNASFNILDYDLNNRGEVSFSGFLDTDNNNDGELDTGLYVSSYGSLRLVARTGTTIPDVGTIARLRFPDAAAVSRRSVLSGAATNDHGQVFFQATLTDGTGVLLVATPSP